MHSTQRSWGVPSKAAATDRRPRFAFDMQFGSTGTRCATEGNEDNEEGLVRVRFFVSFVSFCELRAGVGPERNALDRSTENHMIQS